MKKRKYLLIAIILLALSAIYHVVDHILWLQTYLAESGQPLSSEIVPLIFSLVFLLPPLMMFLLWQSKKEITPAYLWIMVIGSFIIIFALYAGRKSEDALAAGLVLSVAGVPIAIVISILAGMEWRKK